MLAKPLLIGLPKTPREVSLAACRRRRCASWAIDTSERLQSRLNLSPQRSPSRSARVAPSGPTLPHPTAPVQPSSSRAGPPQPLAPRAPAGPLRCRGVLEEPWGRAVGGACSPAGGAGGLPGGSAKIPFVFPIRFGSGERTLRLKEAEEVRLACGIEERRQFHRFLVGRHSIGECLSMFPALSRPRHARGLWQCRGAASRPEAC